MELTQKFTKDEEIELTMVYAESIVDNMDFDTLQQFAFDSVMDRLWDMSFDDLLNEIQEDAPEILSDFLPYENNLTSGE